MHLCATKTELLRIACLEIRGGRHLAGHWQPCTIWLNAWYFCTIPLHVLYFTNYFSHTYQKTQCVATVQTVRRPLPLWSLPPFPTSIVGPREFAKAPRVILYEYQ